VLKEAMRLDPPACAVGRHVADGDEIGGYTIPPGGDVMVSPWVTHRHPDFWDAPLRFDPERFTPEAEAERHRHAYFPFGAGPRACIGQYFSMLEAAILLAVIVRDHRLTSLSDDIPLAPRITLHPAAPVPSRSPTGSWSLSRSPTLASICCASGSMSTWGWIGRRMSLPSGSASTTGS
jgi:cytochrome P450